MTSSTARRSTRRAGTRSSARTPRKYNVDNGGLTITTVRRRHLHQQRPAGHAELLPADRGSHRQPTTCSRPSSPARSRAATARAASSIYSDDDNYVKLDAISDTNQTRINRIELRSEVAGAIAEPAAADHDVPAGHDDIWLRLTKAGTTYTGEYSFDGTTWTVDRRRRSPTR